MFFNLGAKTEEGSNEPGMLLNCVLCECCLCVYMGGAGESGGVSMTLCVKRVAGAPALHDEV